MPLDATTTRGSGEAGQALVEFALVLPLILLLLFGMLQFALVFNARQTVAFAAQAAASGYAQTRRIEYADEQAAAAAAQLRPALRAPAASISYTLIDPRTGAERAVRAAQVGIAADPGRPGDYVIARVTYRYPSPIRAGIGPFRFPDTIPLSLESVARIEAPGRE